MLTQLQIDGLGVIASARVDLKPGFTVLTGETGAGKTMVLTAMNVLLGGAIPPGLANSDRSGVHGVFRVDPDGRVSQRVSEAGGELDEDELIIVRKMPAGGRARTVAGGAAVPAGLLKELADDLIEVHGQSDQVLLRRPARQRELLDRFGGVAIAPLADQCATAYHEFVATHQLYADAVEHEQQLRQEVANLRQGLELIESVDPQPGEDDALSTQAARMAHGEQLRADLSTALMALDDPDDQPSVVTHAATAVRALESATSVDSTLDELHVRARELQVLAGELAIDASRALSDVDSDPAELANVEQRRSQLKDLTRLYGPTIDDVLAWSKQAVERLTELEQATDLEALSNALDQKRQGYVDIATALHDARVKVAKQFSEQVGAELAGLSMPHSQLGVQIRLRPASAQGMSVQIEGLPVEPAASGIDDVALTLTHGSSAPVELAKAASGGELSRVMLAVEVVMADTSAPGTFVFDEVDAGVGGRAAVEIGRRLAALSARHQILVVTHLPQVAAFANHHVLVSKQLDGNVLTSDVRELSGDQRTAELARMLAGQDDSAHATAHADELLDLAARERATRPGVSARR